MATIKDKLKDLTDRFKKVQAPDMTKIERVLKVAREAKKAAIPRKE
jgi:hypothetical protein